MALPSSGPLSFSAIYFELTGSSPETIVKMGKLFNGGYAPINPSSPSQPSSSTPYSLSSFHGYTQTGGASSFNIAQIGDDDPGKSCLVGPGQPSQQVYWSGSGIPIFPGAYIYTDPDLLYPVDGQGFWFYLYDNNTVLQILPDGYVNDIFKCK